MLLNNPSIKPKIPVENTNINVSSRLINNSNNPEDRKTIIPKRGLNADAMAKDRVLSGLSIRPIKGKYIGADSNNTVRAVKIPPLLMCFVKLVLFI